MNSNYLFKISSILLMIFLFLNVNSHSQVIKPAGTTDELASQLIHWYDQDGITTGRSSLLQITNTNDVSGVWLHVQVFRSFDSDESLETPDDKVICNERDFVDFLTPNDTHVYILGTENFAKNEGEGSDGTGSGVETSLDLRNSKGFVVVTPVVNESDLTAISFPYLHGTTIVTEENRAYRLNAMGREAVDFTTGELTEENTPLDGTTNGFALIQPEELYFNFLDAVTGVVEVGMDVVGITFQDSYGPPGLLGYSANPADVSLISFLFDSKEDPTSCGSRDINCFSSIGLNEDKGDANALLDNEVLCPGVDILITDSGFRVGAARIFISGFEDSENLIGLTTLRDTLFIFGSSSTQIAGADWMITRGTETIVRGAGKGPREIGKKKCSDRKDNDGDRFTDCRDSDCDRHAGCEFETELTCNDNFDNDADGLPDCRDSDCKNDSECIPR